MWRALPLLMVTLGCAACDKIDPPPDAGERVDAGAPGMDSAARPTDIDATHTLTDCGDPEQPHRCLTRSDHVSARWHFQFSCPPTSRWRVDLEAPGAGAILFVQTAAGEPYGRADPADATADGVQRVEFTSVSPAGLCEAIVELPRGDAFALTLWQEEGPLDAIECARRCLDDSGVAAARGCDCTSTCHDACTDLGTDCGLPCNADVPEYRCPFLESEIRSDGDCTPYARDTGAFEHVGSCYRCGTGQQCCYTDGRDNGTGSFDICPPLDPGPDDPDPYGCSGVFDHCACDVVPLCGCMAESGSLALCARCVGEGNFDFFSCNAAGDDATFCRRALDAADAGFSWCARLGDVNTCFQRPPGF